MARAWVGTSGFSFKEWKPSFYPKEVSAKDFLRFYASQFDTVEIDGTFYRVPRPPAIEAWKGNTPESFRFAFKATQFITHFQRLKLPSNGAGLALSAKLGQYAWQCLQVFARPFAHQANLDPVPFQQIFAVIAQ